MREGATTGAPIPRRPSEAATFQRVLMDLAVGFVNAPVDALDREIDAALARIGAFTGADRAYLFAYDLAAATTTNTHEWCAPGITPVIDDLQQVPLRGLDHWVSAHLAGRTVHIPSVTDMTHDPTLRAILAAQGIDTLITVPLQHQGSCLGFVGFDAVGRVKLWTDEEISLLKVLAELFTNALVRRDRDRELLAARAAAEAANEAKTRFMATVSHELRTPMHGVLGMTELLLDTTDLTSEQQRYVVAVQRSGQTLRRLLDDILDLGRIEAGRLELVPVPFDPRAQLREVTDLASAGAEAKDLRLRVEVADDVPDGVVADDGRIRQVLGNVVANAITYTEEGAVTVRLEVAFDDGARCSLRWTVADTGPGVPEDELPRLFEPFTQVGRARAGDRGAGLGLTIVRELTELMDGHVAVRSTPGVGSEFEVVLPLPLATGPSAPSRRREQRRSRELGSRSLPTRRVLVVEDDEVSRTLLQAHLSSLGCTVVSVEDGTAAVEVAAQGFVDLILMDGRLPGLGGIGAIRRLREQHPPRQLPILVVTASVTSEDREAYLSAGADGVLAKPYTRDELVAALGDVVERRPTTVAAPGRSVPVPDVAALEAVVSFDPAALDGLASSGYADPGLPRRLLELFWHDTVAQLRDLRVAADGHDADEVVELAHRLRSSSAAVGAARVAATAELLERRARAGDLDGEAAALVGALSTAFEQARDAGARYLAVRTGA